MHRKLCGQEGIKTITVKINNETSWHEDKQRSDADIQRGGRLIERLFLSINNKKEEAIAQTHCWLISKVILKMTGKYKNIFQQALLCMHSNTLF